MGLAQSKRKGWIRKFAPTSRRSSSGTETGKPAKNNLSKNTTLLLYKRFGRPSEQDDAQPRLFEVSEQFAEAEKAETYTVGAHQRKNAGRKLIDESVPRVEILHGISDES